MKIRSWLYRLARIMGDLNAVSNPTKLARRGKNKLLGRFLWRLWR